ncbi:MAG TPA: polyprenol monophosphomannose synthase [Candidatus Anammoximicrobium sp.]|nr:polyprenol monophosphomannose synthase [Candidatus Anammoximicrobium sp.]
MPEPPPASTLIVMATYNELQNLPDLTEEILRHAPDVHLLVVDDNSPDGTGRWCDERAAADRRFQVIHRPGKLGLGTATIAGLRYAVQQNYEYALVMDADFSHHPRYLPDLRRGIESEGSGPPPDVMIGSRYVPGGGVQGWPWPRRWMSRGVNRYARWWLRLPGSDISSAFRCYRVATLRRLDWNSVRARGYAFEEEILWWLRRHGARFGETPIVFVDRQRGQSKVDAREALSAIWNIFILGLRGWFTRPAASSKPSPTTP